MYLSAPSHLDLKPEEVMMCERILVGRELDRSHRRLRPRAEHRIVGSTDTSAAAATCSTQIEAPKSGPFREMGQIAHAADGWLIRLPERHPPLRTYLEVS